MPEVNQGGASITRTAWIVAGVVTVVGVALSVFQLYTAGLEAMTALRQRGVHISLILVLVFLIKPFNQRVSKERFNLYWVFDIFLILVVIAVGSYIFFGLEGIYRRQGDWSQMDFIVGVIWVFLILEATRRVIGYMLMFIGIAFLLYGYFGRYMPEVVIHKGYSMERIATTLSLTTEGIFGLPLGVAATFVFIFILFGAFLDKTGAGNFFINMAYSLTGRFAGGPAKTSVIASGFMGSVSGSAIANVVSTGSFTIPMMKRLGYKSHVSGGIEAAASTGGQLMPPIMGAGAFLMAEFTNTPYLDIIKVALIPAVLYFMTTMLFVHIAAHKEGIWGLRRDQLPSLMQTIKDGMHFLVPLAILITALLQNYSPMMAGFVAVVSVFAFSFIRKASRLSLKGLVKTLELGARNAIMVSTACAVAGIIVGIVNLTGMGLRFSSMVVSLSHGIPLLALALIALASLVLGMGLPVTASYIVVVILAGPALTEMGMHLIAAHMIVFWYSQDANVTPPVSLASFAAAGVANASPMKTAFSSWKLSKGLYIIPVVMAYHPALLLYGTVWDSVVRIFLTGLAVISLVVCLERFFTHWISWVETVLYGVIGIGLIWPDHLVNYACAVGFGCLLFFHLWQRRRIKQRGETAAPAEAT